MKKLFIVGGMGAGKSTVTKTLTDLGLPVIDLDKVGHIIHKWETVKDDLREEFGDEVFDEAGEVDRSALAAVAFRSPAETRKLNRITHPRIEQVYFEEAERLEREGHIACAVEYSTFRNRKMSIADDADVVIAVLCPLDTRVARAVAAGWDEADVRRRMALQVSDAERAEVADVIFHNDRTPEDVRNDVLVWWDGYRKQLEAEAAKNASA